MLRRNHNGGLNMIVSRACCIDRAVLGRFSLLLFIDFYVLAAVGVINCY